MYTWQIANPEEFIPVCDLFLASELGKGKSKSDIDRRIALPLIFRQLITFYNCGKLCGFITFAWLCEQSEKNMRTIGIMPQDWRSGSNFWAVDYIVNKGCDGYKMLRAVTKGLGVKKARYFRHKFQQIREVRPI